jgi:Protein of unknown function (DUF1488)
MREGHRTVLCIVTREALIEVFGSSDQGQWEAIFKANRAMIEAIASDMHDADETPAPVRMTSRELEPRRLIPFAVTALNRSTSDAAFSPRTDGGSNRARPLPSLAGKAS